MTDRASLALLEQLHSNKLSLTPNDKILLIADENTHSAITSLYIDHKLYSQYNHLTLLSNRYDVAEQLQSIQKPKNTQKQEIFSDFDLSDYTQHSLSAIFYRISKEKPVVHHIINQAKQKLKTGGILIFCGYKSEGTKTYFNKAKRYLGGDAKLKKDGDTYTATLVNNTGNNTSCNINCNISNSATPTAALDDKNYTQLRTTVNINDKMVMSKPGLFGWNKIDRGSELLISQLPLALDLNLKKPTRMLDLGCGYGYLTLASAKQNFNYRCATDNNAAAITAAKANFKNHQLEVTTLAADCGQGINETFDLILCNPPFHQGFSVDGDLTDKFLQQTHNLLSASGWALFVVNQFVPLEQKAEKLSFSSKCWLNNGQFKVIQLFKESL